jgi:small subunit ribosomal protein S6
LETKVEKKLYEGMFLVDSADAGSDWEGINAAIKRILERAEAEIVSVRKWDDRRLAYDIRGTSRGTYILCYFKVEGRKIQGIEKAVQLSEKIIRVLILSTEQMSQEDIERDTPATKSEKEKEKTITERAERAEASKQSDKQEAQAPEETVVAEEAKTAEEAQATEETEVTEEAQQPADTEQPEKTEQAEVKAEEPEDSEPKFVSGD